VIHLEDPIIGIDNLADKDDIESGCCISGEMLGLGNSFVVYRSLKINLSGIDCNPWMVRPGED
jgi:hypothetical protein